MIGDRYVKKKMQKYKFNLGGEQSGHIIYPGEICNDWRRVACSTSSFCSEKR